MSQYFPLTESEKTAWDRDGFFIRRDVFSVAECRALQEHAAAIARREVAFPEEHIDGNALIEAGVIAGANAEAGMHKIHHPHLYDQIFRDRQTDSRVVDVVADLLGPTVLGINSLFLYKPPGHGMGFPWHQDLWYFRRRFTTETTVGTWQAIDDADVENGCLWVIPGSHREEIREHLQLTGPQQEEYREAENVDEVGIPVEIPSGSVLFFIRIYCTDHTKILHRTDGDVVMSRII